MKNNRCLSICIAALSIILSLSITVACSDSSMSDIINDGDIENSEADDDFDGSIPDGDSDIDLSGDEDTTESAESDVTGDAEVEMDGDEEIIAEEEAETEAETAEEEIAEVEDEAEATEEEYVEEEGDQPNEIEDLPDENLDDANGDGIDGNIDGAVFVDPVGGDDIEGDGTIENPVRSLAKATEIALAADPVFDLYLASGVHQGQLTLHDGMSVFGGFIAENDWQRSMDAVSTIMVNQADDTGNFRVVTAQGLTEAVELAFVTLQTISDGGAPGSSNYGVWVDSCPDVWVHHCRIQVDNGRNGATGVTGVIGATGSIGSDGEDGREKPVFDDTPTYGGNGGTSCMAFNRGGAGGNGGYGNAENEPHGQDGAMSPGGGVAGIGKPEGNGEPGYDGPDGNDGVPGNGGVDGQVNDGGLWASSTGFTGESGYDGAGGGGGGGGGGSDGGTWFSSFWGGAGAGGGFAGSGGAEHGP